MHKLERPQPPACLKKYHHGRDRWRDLTDEHREEIWQALEIMQDMRCAYCECDLQQHGRHIEHFRQRNPRIYPQGTFNWGNLFGSCERQDSCGKHKDNACGPDNYDYQNLIKPDIDNPDDYLIFVADGSIHIRDDLTVPQRKKAEETLRVFNLDSQHGALRRMRESAVYGYLETAEMLAECAATYDEAEWLPFYQEELHNIQGLPFETAIRHALTPIDG